MIIASQKCVFDKRGLGYKSSKNKNILKTTLSKNPQVKDPQLFAIFMVEEDTLVVLVFLGIDPKMC